MCQQQGSHRHGNSYLVSPTNTTSGDLIHTLSCPHMLSTAQGAASTSARLRETAGCAKSSSSSSSSSRVSSKAKEAELRPVRAGWLKYKGVYQDSESFIPCPFITFLIDKPRNLVCQICHESHLDLRTDQIRLTDRTPAMLPCGHVAGLRCLREWLGSLEEEGKAPQCPFCRQELTYRECGHRVPERPLTRENIHLLPPTLHDGGRIPPRCWDCRRPRIRLAHHELFSSRKQAFLEARDKALVTGREEDELALVLRKKEFESAVSDSIQIQEMTSRAAQW